jgi:hypothetical protein
MDSVADQKESGMEKGLTFVRFMNVRAEEQLLNESEEVKEHVRRVSEGKKVVSANGDSDLQQLLEWDE